MDQSAAQGTELASVGLTAADECHTLWLQLQQTVQSREERLAAREQRVQQQVHKHQQLEQLLVTLWQHIHALSSSNQVIGASLAAVQQQQPPEQMAVQLLQQLLLQASSSSNLPEGAQQPQMQPHSSPAGTNPAGTVPGQHQQPPVHHRQQQHQQQQQQHPQQRQDLHLGTLQQLPVTTTVTHNVAATATATGPVDPAAGDLVVPQLQDQLQVYGCTAEPGISEVQPDPPTQALTATQLKQLKQQQRVLGRLGGLGRRLRQEQQELQQLQQQMAEDLDRSQQFAMFLQADADAAARFQAFREQQGLTAANAGDQQPHLPQLQQQQGGRCSARDAVGGVHLGGLPTGPAAAAAAAAGGSKKKKRKNAQYLQQQHQQVLLTQTHQQLDGRPSKQQKGLTQRLQQHQQQQQPLQTPLAAQDTGQGADKLMHLAPPAAAATAADHTPSETHESNDATGAVDAPHMAAAAATGGAIDILGQLYHLDESQHEAADDQSQQQQVQGNSTAAAAAGREAAGNPGGADIAGADDVDKAASTGTSSVVMQQPPAASANPEHGPTRNDIALPDGLGGNGHEGLVPVQADVSPSWASNSAAAAAAGAVVSQPVVGLGLICDGHTAQLKPAHMFKPVLPRPRRPATAAAEEQSTAAAAGAGGGGANSAPAAAVAAEGMCDLTGADSAGDGSDFDPYERMDPAERAAALGDRGASPANIHAAGEMRRRHKQYFAQQHGARHTGAVHRQGTHQQQQQTHKDQQHHTPQHQEQQQQESRKILQLNTPQQQQQSAVKEGTLDGQAADQRRQQQQQPHNVKQNDTVQPAVNAGNLYSQTTDQQQQSQEVQNHELQQQKQQSLPQPLVQQQQDQQQHEQVNPPVIQQQQQQALVHPPPPPPQQLGQTPQLLLAEQHQQQQHARFLQQYSHFGQQQQQVQQGAPSTLAQQQQQQVNQLQLPRKPWLQPPQQQHKQTQPWQHPQQHQQQQQRSSHKKPPAPRQQQQQQQRGPGPSRHHPQKHMLPAGCTAASGNRRHHIHHGDQGTHQSTVAGHAVLGSGPVTKAFAAANGSINKASKAVASKGLSHGKALEEDASEQELAAMVEELRQAAG